MPDKSAHLLFAHDLAKALPSFGIPLDNPAPEQTDVTKGARVAKRSRTDAQASTMIGWGGVDLADRAEIAHRRPQIHMNE